MPIAILDCAVAGSNQTIDVLVVDDELPVRQSLTMALSHSGLTAVAAANGKEALALLASRPVRLLVTDINMPEIDGFEVMVEVAASRPGLPILAMSGGGGGDGPEGVLRSAQAFAPSRTLAKPFDLATFLSAVNELLNR